MRTAARLSSFLLPNTLLLSNFVWIYNISILMAENKELSINLKPEVATGKYSNLAIMTHSKSEFILDFAAMLPGLNQPEVVSRVIMTPEHAKRLLLALQDNVSKFENQFGTIGLDTAPAMPGFPFNGGNGAKS